MRIIAGQHRGRKLLGPVGRATTRPITDRVKTSLFDRLAAADRLEDAVVLDLFAGTGSMGLECLSRGAAHVTFIEKDREALRRLRRNLRTIGQGRQSRTLSRDILSPALPAELNEPDEHTTPFTLIFVDPPYALIEDPRKAQRLHDRLADLASIAADEAWLILRTPKQTEPATLPNWRGPDSKTHGSMTLHLYRKPPTSDPGTLSAPMSPPPPTDDAGVDPARLRAAARKLVEILQQEGHVAYFAGGCVRDEIMGRPPTDYDVATDATPEQVLELFRVARRVGEAFGVVMVRLKGCWIEVATFRTEWGYSDGRHPDHLVYSDAEHDARRRDFTINGLFYDPVADQVIDYVDGRADIDRRLVRAIGDPAERFAEDYLRMLRAVRFAARLGFAIEPATAEAIRNTAPRLDRISRERIGAEVRMMLEHPNRARAAGLIQELRLDAPTLNEKAIGREPTVLQRLPDVAPDAPATYPIALAAWAIDRHLPERPPASPSELADQLSRLKRVALVRKWRKAVMLSNDHRDALDQLLTQLPTALTWFELSVPQRKRLLGRDDWPALRSLLYAALTLPTDEAFDTEAFEADVAQLEAEGPAPEPLISGDDLIAAGLKPGPAFKQILQQTYDAQLAGEITTADQARQFALSRAEQS